MAKGPRDNGRRRNSLVVLLAICGTILGAYLCFSSHVHNFAPTPPSSSHSSQIHVANLPVADDQAGCCRGLEHTELWSDAVNWGSDFLLDSAQECCDACKTNLKCNSWVYCADQANCGSNYRQCWLKNQKNPLNPDVHDSSPSNPWTSGLVFDNDIGKIGFATGSRVIHFKDYSDCAPRSVMQILELAKLTHCSGCCFYRAEGRANLWDVNGSHVSRITHMDKFLSTQMSTGPPYAVVQGTLEAHHVPFKGIPKEYTPAIRRGMVGWVGQGPDFFISLADHLEWPRKHTVFATVVNDDMHLVESLAALPTTTVSWQRVSIQALDKPVALKVQKR